MSIGNILAVIETKFGPITVDEFTDRWNAGHFERYRPDGHQWFVEIDPDGDVTSVEALSVTEMAKRLPQETKRDDILVTRQTRTNGSIRLSINLIPIYVLRSESPNL